MRESVLLHLWHITHGGDPYELQQARPLDFGHWSAHKLEAITNYRLRHGEAVAIGVAVDTVYSHLKLGPRGCRQDARNLARPAVADLGFGKSAKP